MTYAFIQDVPANEEMYGQIKSRLGTETPAGLICHLAIPHGGGLRYVDVWESREQWERYRIDVVEPAVDAVLGALGIPHDHSMVRCEEFEPVDVWLGGGVSTPA
jgi:hypothetical protein